MTNNASTLRIANLIVEKQIDPIFAIFREAYNSNNVKTIGVLVNSGQLRYDTLFHYSKFRKGFWNNKFLVKLVIKHIEEGSKYLYIKDRLGSTLMHHAPTASEVSKLYNMGVSLHDYNKRGITPVGWAMRYGTISAAKRMIALGACLDVSDHNGYPMIYYGLIKLGGRFNKYINRVSTSLYDISGMICSGLSRDSIVHIYVKVLHIGVSMLRNNIDLNCVNNILYYTHYNPKRQELLNMMAHYSIIPFLTKPILHYNDVANLWAIKPVVTLQTMCHNVILSRFDIEIPDAYPNALLAQVKFSRDVLPEHPMYDYVPHWNENLVNIRPQGALSSRGINKRKRK